MSNKSNHSNSSAQSSTNQDQDSGQKSSRSSRTICRVLKTFKRQDVTDFEFSLDFKHVFVISHNELEAYCSKTFRLVSNFKRLVGSKSTKKKIQSPDIGPKVRHLKVLSNEAVLQFSDDHYQIFYFGRTLQGQKMDLN